MLISVAAIIRTAANIFGDWLLVFPLQMGLKGVAIATGASQVLAMLIVLPHFLLKKGRLYFKCFRPDSALFHKIAVRGLPEVIAQLATPVTFFVLF